MLSIWKSTMKSYRVLQEFFAQETKPIALNIKEISDLVKRAKSSVESSDMSKLEALKALVESSNSKIKLKEKLKDALSFKELSELLVFLSFLKLLDVFFFFCDVFLKLVQLLFCKGFLLSMLMKPSIQDEPLGRSEAGPFERWSWYVLRRLG